jgi:transposase-like protein
MLAMENFSRAAGRALTVGPACPNCGRSMHLARMAPRSEGVAELRVYRCGECGVSLSEAADEATAAACE